MNNELINISKGELMKKLIITMVAGLLMASGLWAEQKVCSYISDKPWTDEYEEQKNCQAGDVLLVTSNNTAYPIEVNSRTESAIAYMCDQEKQITLKSSTTVICTYLGKSLVTREKLE